MKILQITNRFSPAIGGVETHVYNISKQLVRNGHSVFVICSDFITLNSAKKFNGAELIGEIDGIKFKRFWSFRLLSLDTLTLIPLLPIFLIKNIKKFDIIHVHSYGYFVGWFTIFLSKIMKKKVIYTPHYAKETVHHLIIKKIYDFLIAGWSFRWATKIIALTKTEKNELTKSFNVCLENITIIPNGINFKENINNKTDVTIKNVFSKYNIDFKNKTIINIARIAQNKGQIYLLEAFSKFKNYNLLIIGKDWGEQERLKKYISLNNLSNVHILNDINDTEKNILLQGSNLFVLPSIGGEAFGIVLLEAMQHGIPVVASRVGGVSDLIISGKNGLLFEPKDTDEMFKKIDIVINEFDPEITKKYCVEFAKKYDWQIIVKAIEEEYYKMIYEKK